MLRYIILLIVFAVVIECHDGLKKSKGHGHQQKEHQDKHHDKKHDEKHHGSDKHHDKSHENHHNKPHDQQHHGKHHDKPHRHAHDNHHDNHHHNNQEKAVCPAGWQLFQRTPTAANSNTKYWCLQVVPEPNTVTIDQASGVCTAIGGVLSAFENENEHQFVQNKSAQVIPTATVHTGSIAVDGRRILQCNTANKTVLSAPPCNDNDKLFVMSDKHTDATYMLSIFSPGEPSANYWTGPNVESCLEMYFLPNINNGKINDFFCDADVSPSNPSGTMYRLYGALCGRAATIKK